MAELPTPHSIAIGTLISLYSDPNSPLLVFDWHNDAEEEEEDYDDERIVGSSGGGNGGSRRLQRNPPSQRSRGRGLRSERPQTTAEWSLRLMELIHQLVMREDEGVIVLPYDEFGLFCGGGINPAEDDDLDDNPARNNGVDSLPMTNSLGNEDFSKKHLRSVEGQDILEDVMGLFGSSIPADDPEMVHDMVAKSMPNDNHVRSTNTFGGLNFMMEPLSTLLNRIDDAYFTSSHQIYSTHRSKRSPTTSAKKRTPPSLALLSRLQMASSSVDDLMNLLDEWHALLDGAHVGYPPPPAAVNNPPAAGPATGNSTIAIDGESTFGVYLRRLCLGMEEIPFEALSRLWDALREFAWEEMKLQTQVQKRGTMEQREAGVTTFNEGGNGNVEDNDDVEEYHWNTAEWLPSSPQIERIVRRTCLEHNLDSLLLRDRDSDNDIQEPSSSSSSHHFLSSSHHKQHFHNLLATHPECPSLHFLLYLSSLANGQRCQALESLHRYFDYAMIHERKERAERAIMLQASGEAGEGVGNMTTNVGIMGGGMTTIASAMGGITGGMNGTFAVGDAMMQAGGQQRGAIAAGAGGAAGNSQGKVIFKESNVMQYAAILLAQTYHRFGYVRLALQATEEAVRVAQQCGDEECVCFANGWLALVSSSVGRDGRGSSGGTRSVYASVGSLLIHGSSEYHDRLLAPPSSTNTIAGSNILTIREEEAMLRRCRARSTERGLTSLAAGASLEMARRLVYRRQGTENDMEDHGGGGRGLGATQEEAGGRGGSVSSLAWASVQSAGRMPSSVVGSLSTAGHGHVGQRVSSTGASSEATDIYNMLNKEALGILGRQNIAIAGLWESTGHTSLASLSSYAALYGAGTSNLGSSTSMMTRVLSSCTSGPGSDVWMRGDRDEDEIVVGSHPKAIGEIYANILNNFILLSEAKRQPPSLHNATACNNKNNCSEWIFSTAGSSTLQEWSVRSYDLSVAQGLHTLLANHAAFPCGGGTAMPAVEASLAFLARSTHLFLQCEEYGRAKVFARHACWLASRHSLMFHQGWHVLQLALIDVEAASTSSSSSIECALPSLLECLDLSERYSMDPLRALALATLAKVLLCMGRHRKARAILWAAMPLVMENGHMWFQGDTFLTSAKCYLAEACSRIKELGGSVCDDGIVGSSSGKRKRQQQQQKQKYDSSTLELRETALLELKQSAFYFAQIEDVRQLRQVYYLQARTSHSLPPTSTRKKQRDEAAKMFAQLSVSKRDRGAASVMSMAGGKSDMPKNSNKAKQQKMRSDDKEQQRDALQGVIITISSEMKRCVSMRLQR